MKKYDFFIRAMKDKAHYKRDWMLRAFSVVFTPPKEKPAPWTIRHNGKVVEGFVPDGDGAEWEVLEGCEGLQIPYVYHEATGPVKAGDVENLKKDLVNSTYGELLANSRILVYAAGELIPFIEGQMHPKILDDYVAKNLTTNPKPGEEPDPTKFYVFNLRRMGKAVADLCGYELFIPSIGIKALQAPPNNEELKQKLLSEAEDIRDPVSQTKIQNELVENYKKHYEGDPSEGLFFKEKTIHTALKRMFLIHGPEAGFTHGGRATLITTSLDDGLNLDYFPDMANSLRGGSYSRGALTALAGTDVDLIGRIFQNTLVQPNFCGTTSTVTTKVNKRHELRWILEAGNRIQLTHDILPNYLGKDVEMYDPAYCWAPNNDLCAYCVGGKMARYPNSLGSNVQERLAFMMSAMMGSAHAKQLKTTPLNVDTFLR